MKVSIFSIEKPLLENYEVESLLYPSDQGERELLNEHMDYKGLISSGKLTVRVQNDILHFAILKGVIEVFENHVIIESTQVYSIDDEKKEQFLTSLKTLEKRLDSEELTQDEYEESYQKFLYLSSFK